MLSYIMDKMPFANETPIIGTINDKKRLSKVDYLLIDPEFDLTNCVINLKINHQDFNKTTLKMKEIYSLLSTLLKPPHISMYRGCFFQIRVNKNKINQIIKIIVESIQKDDYGFQIFISNYIAKENYPIGYCMCDGLIEAGLYFNYYIKKYTQNFIICYDRKSKLKIIHKLKTLNR